MAEIKYDIRRGADIYRAIYDSRLKSWISKGVIKRGETTVCRSGLSGWRKPEELEELSPFFERRDRQRLEKEKMKEHVVLQKKKKKKKKLNIRNVLIIDDEKDLCRLLDRFLSPRGYNVATANTKREALASLRKESPDLVFLDLKLPDGDGMKVLPKIKEANPKTIVNIISAYGQEETREEARKNGVYSFIDKPFGEEDILRSIKTVSIL